MKVVTYKGPESLKTVADETHYYLQASNGTFMALDTDWCKAVVKADIPPEVSGMENVERMARWKLPKIPAQLFAQVAKFFFDVGKKKRTEVMVLLHYNFKTDEWLVTVPEQTVSAAHVDYNARDRVAGFRCVGTMHSHVEMSASHSWVDERDESEIDGLHITVGKVDCYPKIDMDGELNIRKNRFKVKPENVIEGIKSIAVLDKEGNVVPYWERGGKWDDENCSHEILDPKVEVPKAWWEKLKFKSWGNWGGGGYYRKGRWHNHKDDKDNKENEEHDDHGYGSDYY